MSIDYYNWQGVVDSEDIPLNLSRELLQDSSLIRKLRTVLTNRILRQAQPLASNNEELFGNCFGQLPVLIEEQLPQW